MCVGVASVSLWSDGDLSVVVSVWVWFVFVLVEFGVRMVWILFRRIGLSSICNVWAGLGLYLFVLS